ncbi:endonuclease/exonuclease/phosphatase family protein [Nocardioides sp. B-3]|uniref:endonuclease/exonuclease/phosphatase family protein n=1 Tax=Nocardioides sp. B-3 TaxID=2895565 RepID=UPI0021530B6D|nr:endonuclease/exonuclease/phosphatase family protein [Nocardioides sp. B-3]UUZ58548.1 endonuclease/exonuclease/phosphatase family protein [Nocardioides sp. B-3]
MSRTRIASFNVENMFDRPRVMNADDWAEGAPVLAAFARFNELAQLDVYDTGTRDELLHLLEVLGLLRSDSSRFAVLRRIRGKLLTRHRNGETSPVARGRADWVGWVELVTEQVTELATQHTAMVVRDVGADVLGVLEVESRPLLELFSESALAEVDWSPYDQSLLIDGNDARGIDVGLMCRGGFEVSFIRTHIYDEDAAGRIFSRDCAEFHLVGPEEQRLVVLVNHFKSKGYGTPGDPIGAVRRARQAARVAEIYEDLLAEGIDHVAVVGDLNDWPGGGSLGALLEDTSLTDISGHPAFEWNGRLGTWRSGGETAKIDYVLLSPALFAGAVGGRRVPQGRAPRITHTRRVGGVRHPHARRRLGASDHAAIHADIEWT